MYMIFTLYICCQVQHEVLKPNGTLMISYVILEISNNLHTLKKGSAPTEFLKNFCDLYVDSCSFHYMGCSCDTEIKTSVFTRPVIWEYLIRIRKSHIYCEYRHWDLTPHSTI